MTITKELVAPCGQYCGACGIYVAHRDNDTQLKEQLTEVYGVSVDKMECQGCLSDELFIGCQTCSIRSCTIKKGIDGCHQCNDFPCEFISECPYPVEKRIMLRAIPTRRSLGIDRWIEEEEKRYSCPKCGSRLFIRARICYECREPVDVD